MKRERETIKTEIGNFMMSMKYCIAKKKKTIFRDIRYIKIKINDIYIYVFFFALDGSHEMKYRLSLLLT